MRSIEGVWKEYRQGTEGRPSIRRMISDHGTDWQQSKYGYDRRVWAKKRRLIAAIEGLKNTLCITSESAIKLLADHLKKKQIGLHTFTNSKSLGLPALASDADLDISGKCRVGKEWRPLKEGDNFYDMYREYLQNLKVYLGIQVDMR